MDQIRERGTWWIGGYIELVQTGHSRRSWTLVVVGPLLWSLEIEENWWWGCSSSSIIVIDDTVLLSMLLDSILSLITPTRLICGHSNHVWVVMLQLQQLGCCVCVFKTRERAKEEDCLQKLMLFLVFFLRQQRREGVIRDMGARILMTLWLKSSGFQDSPTVKMCVNELWTWCPDVTKIQQLMSLRAVKMGSGPWASPTHCGLEMGWAQFF